MSEPLALIETTEPTLVLPEKTQQAKFELGACLVLYQWEDLTTAVDNQWGGADSEDKREWMVGSVVELFEQSNYVDSDDIEDRILGIMEDEFGVSIEDNSTSLIAVQIIKLYKECAENNFSTIDAMLIKYQEKEQRRGKALESRPKIVNENGEEDSSESEDDETESSSQDDKEMEIDDVPSLTNSGPIVDDEGFELVQRKGRKK
jgi:pre-rRNA-processing protein TSR2